MRRGRRRKRNGEKEPPRAAKSYAFPSEKHARKNLRSKSRHAVAFLKNALIRNYDIRKGAKSKSRNSGMRACLFLRPPNPTPAIIANSRQNRGRGDSAFPLKLLFTDKAVPAASRFSCFARITDEPVRLRARHVCLFGYAVERGTLADSRSCTASLGISACAENGCGKWEFD